MIFINIQSFYQNKNRCSGLYLVLYLYALIDLNIIYRNIFKKDEDNYFPEMERVLMKYVRSLLIFLLR